MGVDQGGMCCCWYRSTIFKTPIKQVNGKNFNYIDFTTVHPEFTADGDEAVIKIASLARVQVAVQSIGSDSLPLSRRLESQADQKERNTRWNLVSSILNEMTDYKSVVYSQECEELSAKQLHELEHEINRPEHRLKRQKLDLFFV